MGIAALLAVTAAGVVAGAINTIIGSGSLVTYPVMVLLGVPPISANVANTVGLAPGAVAGAYSYRTFMHEGDSAAAASAPSVFTLSRGRISGLSLCAAGGALIGAGLLLRVSASTFTLIVPFLIALATVLVACQPRPARMVGAHDDGSGALPVSSARLGVLALLVVCGAVYGGFFSAAQGIIFLAILGVFLPGSIHTHNALKNLLQAIVNVVAALFFIVVAIAVAAGADEIAAGAGMGTAAGLGATAAGADGIAAGGMGATTGTGAVAAADAKIIALAGASPLSGTLDTHTWIAAACVAVGSFIGSPLGAWIGVRIPARVLRISVVIFGACMAVLMAARAFGL